MLSNHWGFIGRFYIWLKVISLRESVVKARQKPATYNISMTMCDKNDYNPSIRETGAEWSQVQGQPKLHSDTHDIVGYIKTSSSFKTNV